MRVHCYVILESAIGFKQCEQIVMTFLSLRQGSYNAWQSHIPHSPPHHATYIRVIAYRKLTHMESSRPCNWGVQFPQDELIARRGR